MGKNQTAPGTLELVRRFVNTLDVENPQDDELGSVAGAQEWAAENGFGRPEIDSAGLESLRGAREAMRKALLAHTGEGDESRTWADLAAAIGSPEVRLAFGDAGTIDLAPGEQEGAGFLIGSLAAAIYDAVRNGSWRRLKACRKHSCLFAFYDHSKNGSGAWCNMAICGNRVKAQRRRERERRD